MEPWTRCRAVPGCMSFIPPATRLNSASGRQLCSPPSRAVAAAPEASGPLHRFASRASGTCRRAAAAQQRRAGSRQQRPNLLRHLQSAGATRSSTRPGSRTPGRASSPTTRRYRMLDSHQSRSSACRSTEAASPRMCRLGVRIHRPGESAAEAWAQAAAGLLAEAPSALLHREARGGMAVSAETGRAAEVATEAAASSRTGTRRCCSPQRPMPRRTECRRCRHRT